MSTVADPLSASMENYLETILLLSEEHAVARSRDIAGRLGVNRSSVTGALQALRERGLINYEPYGYATLTEDGTRIARRVLRRHEALRDFFVRVLGIDEQEADDVACRMEHGISKTVVDRLIEFAEFVAVCPRAGGQWIQEFGFRCRSSMSSESCERCIVQCLDDWQETARAEDTSVQTVSLKDLRPGECGLIERVAGAGPVKRRIRDMGATTGSLVEVVRVAPMGDPLDVKIKGYHLSLRKEEAAQISVRRIDPLDASS